VELRLFLATISGRSEIDFSGQVELDVKLHRKAEFYDGFHDSGSNHYLLYFPERALADEVLLILSFESQLRCHSSRGKSAPLPRCRCWAKACSNIGLPTLRASGVKEVTVLADDRPAYIRSIAGMGSALGPECERN